MHNTIKPLAAVAPQKLIINAAITGMVADRNHSPHVPLTVAEIIDDALRCYQAGASIVHLHARDASAKPSCDREIYADIIQGIRDRCPELIICVTTSGRTDNRLEARANVLNLKGTVKPDMASLTLGSLNFPSQAQPNAPDTICALAMRMREQNIVPELEIFDLGMIHAAATLIHNQILQPPFYANLLLGSLYSAAGSLLNLACMIQQLPPGFVWSVAGIGRKQTPLCTVAIAMGGHVRIGLEDNLYYDFGKKVPATNEMLIARVVRITAELGRHPASPGEARNMLGLSDAPR